MQSTCMNELIHTPGVCSTQLQNCEARYRAYIPMHAMDFPWIRHDRLIDRRT